jgi:hypothetical protein
MDHPADRRGDEPGDEKADGQSADDKRQRPARVCDDGTCSDGWQVKGRTPRENLRDAERGDDEPALRLWPGGLGRVQAGELPVFGE